MPGLRHHPRPHRRLVSVGNDVRRGTSAYAGMCPIPEPNVNPARTV